MTVTNRQSGTNVHEIADGVYRINTPVTLPGGGGFSFNQYLITDDEPLLFHTGLRRQFPLVREAVASILPPERLRHIAFSHVEADECGALNHWLAAAPGAAPSAAPSPRWSRSRTSPTDRPLRWLTRRRWTWAATSCGGSTPPTFRTPVNAAS